MSIPKRPNEWLWTGIAFAFFGAFAVLVRCTPEARAQVAAPVPSDPFSSYGQAAQYGLGGLAFLALLWFLRWQAAELKASRTDFLLALDKRAEHDTVQQNLNREQHARQTAGLHAAIDTNHARTREALDDLAGEVRSFNNGRGRSS